MIFISVYLALDLIRNIALYYIISMLGLIYVRVQIIFFYKLLLDAYFNCILSKYCFQLCI